ncbi:hypothetical protein PAHAL_4G306700 [Panicum hallii]|uniref:SAM domain-containing protein n=1 Tax=Panicum hallii TaxID=206008 RepID=A0A2T8JEH2_9POAL|nr:uncharacterized protein LOC112889935 [Panicum hallii]PVH48317.1 hypothetical protein PAHAL_4G306700 [Panicum hallii]
MDWYAWLCRAGLHPDVALDYALLFARNELGADDVRHLDHEVLTSMGVAVAKHRIEILKLARKESSSRAAVTALPWRATRLLAAAVRRSARSALGRLRASVSSAASRGLDRARGSGRDRAAAAVHALATPGRAPLPARHRGGRAARGWGWGAIVASPVAAARGGKPPLPLPMVLAQVSRPVVLTSSCAATVKALPAPPGPVASVVAADDGHGEEESDGDGEGEMDGGEEMRWESMFQDLKPT